MTTEAQKNAEMIAEMLETFRNDLTRAQRLADGLRSAPKQWVIGMGAQALVREVAEAGEGAYNLSGNPLSAGLMRWKQLDGMGGARKALERIREQRGDTDQSITIISWQQTMSQYVEALHGTIKSLETKLEEITGEAA